MKVYFVGAGPGDPELITLKGKRLLAEADVVIYAGSLVNSEILKYTGENTLVHNSAGMDLDEILKIIEDGVNQGHKVVRLHTGDPGLYGAIQEQINSLEDRGINCEVVPGVSSMAAAAAALGKELTQPGVTQSVIITRIEGRTPVPVKEELALLARHQCSMCIFLSVHRIAVVVDRLREEYPDSTPVAVVYKASWPDQKILVGSLADITKKVESEGVEKTALILVGDFLAGRGEPSLLYNPEFSHGFREAGK